MLQQIDRRLVMLAAIDKVNSDPRDPRYIEHSQLSLLRQRIFGICRGMKTSLTTSPLVPIRRYKHPSNVINRWAANPRFADWRTGSTEKRLSISDRRYTRRPLLTVRFGNIDPAHRTRPVALLQSLRPFTQQPLWTALCSEI